MQRIEKRPEPACMAKLRREAKRVEAESGKAPTPNDWNTVPGEQQAAMQQGLHCEQHGLCAYCQGSIALTAEGRARNFTIEHVIARTFQTPQDPAAGARRMFDWDNLVAVCEGKSWCGETEYTHCDTSRGNDALDIDPLHPAIETNVVVGVPRDHAHTGARILPMDSPDPEYQRQLDDVLCLNNPVLGANRLKVRASLRDEARRRSSKEARRYLIRMLAIATATEDGTARPPYARVVAEYCARKLDGWSG